MSFNPDAVQEAREVVFSRKIMPSIHPTLLFDNSKTKPKTS